ncbi:hypothetical protein B0H10DRAFT_2052969 [Mycena sp. CBHHK59/15]|nr:hypothetical protein B0H10DRAFT_2052969 [Mycena sp. CBHHK59/15]
MAATAIPNVVPSDASPAINLSDLKTTIRMKNFMQYETAHMITSNPLAHPKHQKIGATTALRIRHRCYERFLEVMDLGAEMWAIGSSVFDKNGQVRPWLVDHDFHKRSGVWRRELNIGRLIFVFYVCGTTGKVHGG